MAKPLDEFGGWLKAYYVLMIIGVIAGMVALLLSPAALFEFKESAGIPGGLFGLIIIKLCGIPLLILGFYALSIIKKREPRIPSLLAIFLIINVIVSVFMSLCESHWASLHPLLPVRYQPQNFFFSAIQKIGLGLIWFQYFRVSKRVKLYYGGNAFEK